MQLGVSSGSRLLVIVPLLTALMFGQRGGTPQPPPPSATGPHPMTGPTRPESIQDSGTWGYWTHMTDSGRAGGSLIGKVKIEGEIMPWDPILVTVSCNDSTVYTAQTDSRGDFAISPTRIKGELSQQNDAQRQMQVHYEGCAVLAFLTGFRSTKIVIGVRHLRDDPNLGTIMLSRDSNAKATALSMTSQTVSENAARSWEKAGEYMMAQKPDKAQRELEKAVQAYPGFADGWYQLGRLKILSSPRDAKICFEKATAADPTFVLPYEQLASLAVQNEDWKSALENTRRYLQLDPDGSMRVWYFDALASYQIGKVGDAEHSAKNLVKMDPLHNIRNGEQLLAAILARRADYAGAIEHLKNCLTYTPEGPDADLLKQQIAQLEKHVPRAN